MGTPMSDFMSGMGGTVFWLALNAAAVCFLAVTVFCALRLRSHNLQLTTALDNMSQGLCMFDSSARLVVGNKRYLEIYGLSPDLTKPGRPFRDPIKQRIAAGTFPGDPEKNTAATTHEISQGNPVPTG